MALPPPLGRLPTSTWPFGEVQLPPPPPGPPLRKSIKTYFVFSTVGFSEKTL